MEVLGIRLNTFVMEWVLWIVCEKWVSVYCGYFGHRIWICGWYFRSPILFGYHSLSSFFVFFLPFVLSFLRSPFSKDIFSYLFFFCISTFLFQIYFLSFNIMIVLFDISFLIIGEESSTFLIRYLSFVFVFIHKC